MNEQYKGYHIEILKHGTKYDVSIFKYNKSRSYYGTIQYDHLMSYTGCESENEAMHKAKRYVNKREGYTYHRTGRYLK